MTASNYFLRNFHGYIKAISKAISSNHFLKAHHKTMVFDNHVFGNDGFLKSMDFVFTAIQELIVVRPYIQVQLWVQLLSYGVPTQEPDPEFRLEIKTWDSDLGFRL